MVEKRGQDNSDYEDVDYSKYMNARTQASIKVGSSHQALIPSLVTLPQNQENEGQYQDSE